MGRGDRNKNLHSLILCVCVEAGHLLQAPINITLNWTGTLYYWCICVCEGEIESLHYVREALCGKGNNSLLHSLTLTGEIVTRATLTRRRVSRNRDTGDLYSETSVTNS